MVCCLAPSILTNDRGGGIGSTGVVGEYAIFQIWKRVGIETKRHFGPTVLFFKINITVISVLMCSSLAMVVA